jgi:hypothetical protein
MTIFAQADARRRITLPPNAGIKPGDPMTVEVLEDGSILIVPIVAIPRSQLWAWAPKVLDRVAASMADPRPSRQINSKEDLNALARELGVDPTELD